MTNTFALFSQPDQRVLQEKFCQLARLAGVELRLNDATGLEGVPGRIFTSPQSKEQAPPGAIVVALAGDKSAQGLILPQDEALILSLLALQNPAAPLLSVHGLVHTVDTTLVSCLLSARLSAVSGESVCLVDLSGSTLPLMDYLAPTTGDARDWRDLIVPGPIAPARLAAGLPQWEGVSVLGGAGFLSSAQASQVEAVVRVVRQAFSLVVLHYGGNLGAVAGISRKPPLEPAKAGEVTPPATGAFASKASVLVSDCSLAAVEAGEALGSHLATLCAPGRKHLVILAKAGIAHSQVDSVLSASFGDSPVEVWRFKRRDWTRWGREGLALPLKRRITRQVDAVAARLLAELNATNLPESTNARVVAR